MTKHNSSISSSNAHKVPPCQILGHLANFIISINTRLLLKYIYMWWKYSQGKFKSQLKEITSSFSTQNARSRKKGINIKPIANMYITESS